jgi:hypothetical protein
VTESEKKNRKGNDTRTNPSVQIHVPRSFTSLLCVALIVPYLVAAGYFWQGSRRTGQGNAIAPKQAALRDEKALVNEKASLLKPGPWGDVEYVPLMIECPDEYLSSQADEVADRRWFFSGYSQDQLHSFFASIAQLSTTQQKQLVAAKLEGVAGGLYLTPPPDVVMSLEPEARKKIYRVLTQFAENNLQREAYVFPAESFDNYFKDTEVATGTKNLVRKLCYPYGKLLLFADLPYVLDTLPAFEQKQHLEKAISRRSTVLLRLCVNPRTDVNALVNYWGRGGTSKDLKPLLQSLGNLPQGERINIALLLPPLPTSRLYTYPFPSFNQPENCHWTSFNFFRDPPDNRYSELKFLREKLDSEYHPMFSDPRYGDLVFLTKPNGDIVHSAVFIADDIVFTKNGGHFSAPWMFMRLPELTDSYGTFVAENVSLKTVYYRNKYF